MAGTSVGAINVAFGADTSALQSGISVAKGLLGGIGVAFAAGATAAVGLGVASVKAAGDFNQGLVSLSTGAGEAQSNLKMVGDGILNLSTATGTSTKQLTDGMYMIESAGYHGSAGLNVLKAAAEGAKVGNADLGVVADATTTIMTDFGLKSNQAGMAVNTLTATVASGKTTMQALSASLSSILPTASAAKVGLNDVMGAMATMTGEGVPAANAATFLRQMLMALENPSTAAATALKSVGLTSTQVADEMHTSLPGAVQMITDALAKKFPVGSQAYVKALSDISGGSKQMQAMLDLSGQHLQTFKDNVVNVSDAVKKGGDSINGWSQVQGDFNQQMAQLGATINVVEIKLGEALLPALTAIVKAVTPLIASFGDWITKSNVVQNVTSALSSTANQIAQAISAIFPPAQKVATAFTQTTTAGKPLLDTFDRATSIIHTTTSAVKPLTDTFDRATSIIHTTTTATKPLLDTFDRATGVFHSGNDAAKPLLDTFDRASGVIHVTTTAVQQNTTTVNPWIAVIRTAVTVFTTLGNIITTTITVIKTIKDKWDQWKPIIEATSVAITVAFTPAIIKSGVESVVAGTKIAVSYVANIIKTGIEGWQSAAKVATFTASMIKTGVEAVVNGAKIAASFVSSMITSGVQAVTNGAKIVASFVASLITAGAQAIANGAKIVASFVASLITTGIQAIANGAKVVASFVVSMATAGAAAVVNGAKIVASFVASLITTGAQAAATGATMLGELIPPLIAVGVDAVTTAAVSIPALVVAFGAWTVSAGAAAVATIAATWPVLAIIAAVALLVVGIVLLVQHWGQVTAFLQSTWQAFTTWFQGALNNVGSFFAGVWNNITATLGNVWKNIQNWFGNLGSQALQWGKNLIQGFINGIGSMIGAVGQAASNVVGTVGNFLGFHSPAKMGPGADADKWAPNLVNMFAGGLVAGAPQVAKASAMLLSPLQVASGGNIAVNASGSSYPLQGSSSGGGASQGSGDQHIHIMFDGNEMAHYIGKKQQKLIHLHTGVK